MQPLATVISITQLAAAADNKFLLEFYFQLVLLALVFVLRSFFVSELEGKLILSGIFFNAMLNQNKNKKPAISQNSRRQRLCSCNCRCSCIKITGKTADSSWHWAAGNTIKEIQRLVIYTYLSYLYRC